MTEALSNRNDGRMQTLTAIGYLAFIVLLALGAWRLWTRRSTPGRCPPLADDRRDLAFVLWVDEHERLAAEAVEILLEHAADEQRSKTGIERVAASEQHAERSGGCEWMSGGYPARRAHNGGPQCRFIGASILAGDLGVDVHRQRCDEQHGHRHEQEP